MSYSRVVREMMYDQFFNSADLLSDAILQVTSPRNLVPLALRETWIFLGGSKVSSSEKNCFSLYIPLVDKRILYMVLLDVLYAMQSTISKVTVKAIKILLLRPISVRSVPYNRQIKVSRVRWLLYITIISIFWGVVKTIFLSSSQNPK